jgi:hypothetical protein
VCERRLFPQHPDAATPARQPAHESPIAVRAKTFAICIGSRERDASWRTPVELIPPGGKLPPMWHYLSDCPASRS